jgi:hypothetical protein
MHLSAASLVRKARTQIAGMDYGESEGTPTAQSRERSYSFLFERMRNKHS